LGCQDKKGIPFTAEHVNNLYNMLKRNLQVSFELICTTDDSKGINDRIHCIDLLNKGEEWSKGCYRKIRAYDPALLKIMGNRFLMIDLDVVILEDITDLFLRTEDIVLWKLQGRYNTSICLITIGTRAYVWENFNINNAPELEQHYIDRAIPGEAVWTEEDGIYKFVDGVELPENARIIFFNGRHDPSKLELQEQYPWIREHWR
jgi:hypothetical protein